MSARNAVAAALIAAMTGLVVWAIVDPSAVKRFAGGAPVDMAVRSPK